jgi:hypothetical protein
LQRLAELLHRHRARVPQMGHPGRKCCRIFR